MVRQKGAKKVLAMEFVNYTERKSTKNERRRKKNTKRENIQENNITKIDHNVNEKRQQNTQTHLHAHTQKRENNP